MVEGCNVEAGWGLDAATCLRYADALVALVDAGTSAAQLRSMVLNYHADHAQVAALRDARDAAHERAWAAWASQAMAVLRSAGLSWSSDLAVDSEDLAQLVQAELVRALPSFRYQSRFASWAYRVIVQSAQRSIRDSQAAKRAARPASLDDLEAHELPIAEQHNPEHQAAMNELAALIRQALSAHPDQRLGLIFQLWAVEDRRVAEIGAIVGLHPSRVRALLQQCRTLLRADPAIQHWVEPG